LHEAMGPVASDLPSVRAHIPTAMEPQLRLLLLASADAARLAIALQQGGAAPTLALAAPSAFAEALGREGWDVVVASASAMPPAEALRTVAAAQPGLPVVVVAEEGADVEALAAAGAAAVLTAPD